MKGLGPASWTRANGIRDDLITPECFFPSFFLSEPLQVSFIKSREKTCDRNLTLVKYEVSTETSQVMKSARLRSFRKELLTLFRVHYVHASRFVDKLEIEHNFVEIFFS